MLALLSLSQSNDPPATGVTGAGGAGASVGGGGANGGDDFSNMFAGSDFFDFDFGMPSAGDSGTGNGASGFGDWGSFDSNLFGGADNGLSGAGAS